MEKVLVAAALMGIISSTTHAQSSVVLYGLIDAGITYTNNQAGHPAVQETSGNINGSRWGLRGTEDLGGGLNAIFSVETGFNINNSTLAQNSRMFGRQALVGLSSSQYGALTFGRQYDSVVDFLAPLALTGTWAGGTYFTHPFDNDNLDNSIRINNSAKYTKTIDGGLKFGALYGFSNSTSFANNRAYSFGASYNYGGLNVAAGYLQFNNDLSSLALTAAGSGAETGTYAFAAGSQKTFGGGINYTFGPATAGFVYSQTSLDDADGGSVSAGQSGKASGLAFHGNSARFQNFEGNIRYSFTPAIAVAGAYTYTRSNFGGGVRPNFNQFSLYADYAFTKRTDLFLVSEYQHVSSNPEVTAYLNGLSAASSSQSQVAVTAGIRHRF
jgi:GBP family porin